MTKFAVLLVLVLSACTISPPLKSCNDYGDDGDTCKRERALREITMRPREF